MWLVSPVVAQQELGVDEFKRLAALRRWLYPSRVDAMTFRTAPSAVARCEAELCDLSMPRFSFRAYLTPTSFVNARRVNTFAQMAVHWGEPPAGYDEYVDWEHWRDPHRTPASIIRSASCIGDSLLQPPERIASRTGYHLLKTELGMAYGEHREIEGVPFVRHIRLGGGMCGQATCFMATALLQQEARGIYGVAEITALACDQDGPAIFIDGISPDRICNYFNHRDVGLSASRQFIQQSNSQPELAKELGEALFAYCMSNMPVILRVDLGRMCGVEYATHSNTNTGDREDTVALPEDHLFAHNGLADLDTVKSCRDAGREMQAGKRELKPRLHAVLVVGCQSQRPQDVRKPLRFLINDPATYPFLEADASVLANVRHYDPTHWDAKALGPFEFISVTPQAVQLPLLSVPDPRDISHPRMGLKDIAVKVLAQQTVPNIGRFGLPALPTVPKAETRLVNLALCCKKSTESAFHERAAHVPENARQRLVEMVTQRRLAAKWCWIHCGLSDVVGGPQANTVFVWDATVPSPPHDTTPEQLMDKYLLAALAKDTSPEDSAWKEYARENAIKPALISSFFTERVSAVGRAWPKLPRPNVDLYVFMKPEVDKWLRRHGQIKLSLPRGDHPVAVMAQIVAHPHKEKILSDWAGEVCKAFPPEQIVAVSSFVPEVTSPQSWARDMACGAVQFLVEMAYALQQQGHRQLQTVEVVMGSRIGGIWPSLNGKYSATRMDASAARHRMFSILGRVLTPFARMQSNENRIALGIELEPGPLFLLHDWKSLVELCRHIDKDPLLSKFVGVNLDIAHWRLARDITPEQVFDTPEVRNRIVHAHISGHHRCIHGDLAIGDSSDAEGFRPWLELLHRIASDWRAPELPQFSGYVSVELEAAKDPQTVAHSIDELVKLI